MAATTDDAEWGWAVRAVLWLVQATAVAAALWLVLSAGLTG